MEDEIKGKGFVIKDRRKFDEKGEPRPSGSTSEGNAAPRKEGPDGLRAESAAEPKPGPGPETGRRDREGAGYPPVTFSEFIVSLSTSVIYHFGDIPDPVSGKAEKNLDAAKQTIDILGILEQKTRGNLDENEKNLMDAVLFELRMRYVKEKEKK